MALLPVDDALDQILLNASPLGEEWVALDQASRRILSQDLVAKRTHPPFNASAMDGYAVKFEDACKKAAQLKLVGESAAGRGFDGIFGSGECVRIFTGAPVPDSADTILIQENVNRLGHDLIEVIEPAQPGRHIRLMGCDFHEGEILLKRGRTLDFAALTLAASMNYATLPVFQRPRVAVLATGDELVTPGSDLQPDQIIASNSYGIMALAREHGAEIIDLGIAKDRLDDIETAIDIAISQRADILVTIGGASVGDHDLVQQALKDRDMDLSFWKIAMRPGKPLMFGSIGSMRVLGLPGNPASSLVTSILFLSPLIRALAGGESTTSIMAAKTTLALKTNDKRQEYMRATANYADDGTIHVTPFSSQDSSLMHIFAQANALIIREPFAPELPSGGHCKIIYWGFID